MAAGCAGGGGGGGAVYLVLPSDLLGTLDEDTIAATDTSPDPSHPTFLGQSQVWSSGLYMRPPVHDSRTGLPKKQTW